MAAEPSPFASTNSPARRPSAPPADHTAPYAAVRRSSLLRERLAEARYHVSWLVGGLAVAATAVAIILPGSPVLPTLSEFADETGAGIADYFSVDEGPKNNQAPVQVLPDTRSTLD